MGNKAEDCVIVRSAEPFSEQAVHERVASEMKNNGVRRFRPSTRNTGLNGFYYRKLFHGDEVVECYVPKKLKLTAGKMLRRKTVSDGVRWLDEKQQAESARLKKSEVLRGAECPSCYCSLFRGEKK